MNVIAYDLDGTLIDEFGNAIPDEVEKINQLFEDKDNLILIYTARSYTIFHQTRALLITLGIKHHALVMEKLRANFYIDDRARTP